MEVNISEVIHSVLRRAAAGNPDTIQGASVMDEARNANNGAVIDAIWAVGDKCVIPSPEVFDASLHGSRFNGRFCAAVALINDKGAGRLLYTSQTHRTVPEYRRVGALTESTGKNYTVKDFINELTYPNGAKLSDEDKKAVVEFYDEFHGLDLMSDVLNNLKSKTGKTLEVIAKTPKISTARYRGQDIVGLREVQIPAFVCR